MRRTGRFTGQVQVFHMRDEALTQKRTLMQSNHCFVGSKGEGYRGPAVLISPEKELTDKIQTELLWSKSEEAIQDKFEI